MLFIFLLMVSSLKSLHNSNNQIKYIKSEMSSKMQTWDLMSENKNFINDTSWLNYDSWMRECASNANLCIYKNTNDLKILSQKSQEELNKISKTLKINYENKDYSRVVKFIIIDQRKNTFLTNDINNIDFIKSNLKTFLNVEGELYKYVSNKGKWYNISFNSVEAPAYKYGKKSSIENSYNFTEAYWFPKKYKVSKEDESLIKNIFDNTQKYFKENINSESANILFHEKNITENKILLIIFSIIQVIIILILYFLGKKRIIRGIKQSFIVRLFRRINNWFENRTTLFKLCIFILFILSVLFVIISMSSSSRISNNLNFMIISILYLSFALIFVIPKFIKFSRYIDKIIHGTDEITKGNLDYAIQEKGDASLCRLSHNINKINKGFKVSIEDKIKNERLKSELVANVSHDLKTPLTSIINYTDILLREDISEQEKEEFLKILNRKSLKLKNLIENLFEISKINSGKIELKKGNVEVLELINQSIAEYSDTEIYTNKNLSFIVRPFTEKIEMNLDGNRMSRVFENLINNALKYSLENTRVYVEIDSIPRGIKISFKNVSCYALDFDKEEIFERFTRGDASRNSNIAGNGLGLAIAKSIVELHGGIMYVDFDGDLFKAIVELYSS
ncbi:sensor histidine kinase [Haloimpatiens sp. FM7330]|uniref:sensor histidine kinase n=1 Tax=Haloimpatiens sp. FM7330 TaxID=3298610 RepID=UPI0036392E25